MVGAGRYLRDVDQVATFTVSARSGPSGENPTGTMTFHNADGFPPGFGMRSNTGGLHPDPPVRCDGVREVPHTLMAREAAARWLETRERLKPSHDRPWLNLWGQNTVTPPMSQPTFEKILGTYLGKGWTFRRLRNTGVVKWLRAGFGRVEPQGIARTPLNEGHVAYLEFCGASAQRNVHAVHPQIR